MSRRTRLKIRPKERFTPTHHSNYAASTSHFPRSYSLLGNDIQFPTKLLPLYSNNKIYFVGQSPQEFLLAMQNKEVKIETLKQISICISGQKYQKASQIINLLLFSITMCCFCLGFVNKLNKFRSRYYPKYKFEGYQSLVKIINTFQSVETLVINIQDNQINQEKVKRLEDAVCSSKIKHVVIRNMTYFIQVEGVNSFFSRARNKQGLNFAFVWENLVLESRKHDSNQQQMGLVNMSQEIC